MKQVSYKNMLKFHIKTCFIVQHVVVVFFCQHYSQKTSDHLLEDEDENTIYYSKNYSGKTANNRGTTGTLRARMLRYQQVFLAINTASQPV